MSTKRKASSAPSNTTAATKKQCTAPKDTSKAVSHLIPVGDRQRAEVGKTQPDMLRMLCVDKKTNERKELHFKKLVYADIDWNNKEHIDKINAWRNQLYGRAGMKNKTVIMWNKDEEAWLELYWQLVAVEAARSEIRFPQPRQVRTAFNDFFAGRVFLTARGEQLEPRPVRDSGPFVSKMNRMVKTLKPFLEENFVNQTGPYYSPEIDQAMLVEYQKLKADLEKLECKDTKIVPWTEVYDQSCQKDYVLRCRAWINGLPDKKDVVDDNDEEVSEEETGADSFGLSELDEELLELATPIEDRFKLDIFHSNGNVECTAAAVKAGPKEDVEEDNMEDTKEDSKEDVREHSTGNTKDEDDAKQAIKNMDKENHTQDQEIVDTAADKSSTGAGAVVSDIAIRHNISTTDYIEQDDGELTLVGEEDIMTNQADGAVEGVIKSMPLTDADRNARILMALSAS